MKKGQALVQAFIILIINKIGQCCTLFAFEMPYCYMSSFLYSSAAANCHGLINFVALAAVDVPVC
jgi:hypothetical protein